jgi:hypothetical protein
MVTTVSKCCAHTRAAQQYRREERKTRKESTKETENRERLFAYSAPTEKVLDQFISQFRRRAPPKKIHTQNMVILQETKSNKATNAQCVYEFSSCRWSFASIFNPWDYKSYYFPIVTVGVSVDTGIRIGRKRTNDRFCLSDAFSH